jgi:DNA-3-methyladenine glycosylase I
VSLVVGDDGRTRCAWGSGTADYREYHDHEWGVPVRGDRAIFERLTLEAFQSGLSWLTILRKREAFRSAFVGFDVETIAAFGEGDRARLLSDAGIVRNRAKIDATITNARALLSWQESEGDGVLDDLVWSFAQKQRPRPRTMDDIHATSEQSRELSRALKRRGFVFIGPTTMHAALQAMGVLDDHLEGCWVVGHGGT